MEKPNIFTLNESGQDMNSKIIEDIPNSLVKKIFSLDDSEPTALIEVLDKYFIVEVIKTENIIKNLESEILKKTILTNLKYKAKRKFIAEIASKINQNNFIKTDFDKLSKEKNIPIERVSLLNQNDNKILKEELFNKIYTIPEKKIIAMHDIAMTESYLIYIDKIENVTIDEKSDIYDKYLRLSRSKISNELFNTYDAHIRKKYKIDINYKTLSTVKNYFN